MQKLEQFPPTQKKKIFTWRRFITALLYIAEVVSIIVVTNMLFHIPALPFWTWTKFLLPMPLWFVPGIVVSLILYRTHRYLSHIVLVVSSAIALFTTGSPLLGIGILIAMGAVVLIMRVTNRIAEKFDSQIKKPSRVRKFLDVVENIVIVVMLVGLIGTAVWFQAWLLLLALVIPAALAAYMHTREVYEDLDQGIVGDVYWDLIVTSILAWVVTYLIMFFLR